jgi:hypothetical protein
MTAQNAERLLDDFLISLVSPLGFSRVERLIYERQANDIIASLSFPCRVDPRGFAAFTCHVGVRFESLAQWLDDDPKRRVSTVAMPIHLLREVKSLTEWKFSCAEDLERLHGAVLNDLKNLALPFIERYSKLSEVWSRLESPNRQEWFDMGVSVNRRVVVLAAILWTQGDKLGAMKTLDKGLAERMTALPKYRFEIEKLRRRLIEAG